MDDSTWNARFNFGERSFDRFIAAIVALTLERDTLVLSGITKPFVRIDEVWGEKFKDGVDLRCELNLKRFRQLMRLQRMILAELVPEMKKASKDSNWHNLDCQGHAHYGKKIKKPDGDFSVDITHGSIRLCRTTDKAVPFEIHLDIDRNSLSHLLNLVLEELQRKFDEKLKKPAIG
ncbi:MAG: hypothetical protein ACT4OK_08900 [Gemmobacter sp.]